LIEKYILSFKNLNISVYIVGSDQSRNGKSDGMCHGTSGAPRQLSSKAARSD